MKKTSAPVLGRTNLTFISEMGRMIMNFMKDTKPHCAKFFLLFCHLYPMVISLNRMPPWIQLLVQGPIDAPYFIPTFVFWGQVLNSSHQREVTFTLSILVSAVNFGIHWWVTFGTWFSVFQTNTMYNSILTQKGWTWNGHCGGITLQWFFFNDSWLGTTITELGTFL